VVEEDAKKPPPLTGGARQVNGCDDFSCPLHE